MYIRLWNKLSNILFAGLEKHKMSVALSSLRGHFVKHLMSCQHITTFSSFRHRISNLAPPNRLSSLWSAKLLLQKQQRSRNFTAISYSTITLNGSISGDDSLTSPYLSVRISCPSHTADALSESLMCFGASSTTIDLQDDHVSDKEIWITTIFNVSQDVKGCVLLAADSVGLKELPNYEVEMHDHTDWIKQTQESFHPVEIIEGIWIVPEWRSPPNPRAVNIILNPGLAFGTGEHPTTKLCLLLLHRSIKGGESFLDYGTGSCILAIAALKFGADLSVGFDIEPQAITSAKYNAALNNIGPDKLLLSLVPSKNSLHFENENSTDHDSNNSKVIFVKEKYDVIIANILLYPLLDLADRIVSYAMPGAIVGISGIISEQVPSVIKHYSQFLDDITVTTMEDWACISGLKKRVIIPMILYNRLQYSAGFKRLMGKILSHNLNIPEGPTSNADCFKKGAILRKRTNLSISGRRQNKSFDQCNASVFCGPPIDELSRYGQRHGGEFSRIMFRTVENNDKNISFAIISNDPCCGIGNPLH